MLRGIRCHTRLAVTAFYPVFKERPERCAFRGGTAWSPATEWQLLYSPSALGGHCVFSRVLGASGSRCVAVLLGDRSYIGIRRLTLQAQR